MADDLRKLLNDSSEPRISIRDVVPVVLAPAPAPSESDFFPAADAKVNPMLFVMVSLSALAAAFVFFIFLAIRRLYSIWYNRRRQRRRESRQSRVVADQFVDQDLGLVVDHPIWHIRTVGLQPSVINKIAVVRYKKGDALIEGTDCAVCLSEFQHDESLRILPKCNHPFHLPCIDTWLRSHTNCPICRAGIVENPSGDRSAETSDEDEINRDREMVDTEANEHDPELRIEIHDPNGSLRGQKMEETFVGEAAQTVGRSVSMDSRLWHPGQSPVARQDEMNDIWYTETGAASSSSPASSLVQRSASCNAKVFPPR